MTLDHLPPEMRRTHRCGELRPHHAGTRAVAMGWVSRRRDLGSLIFIDLRDRSGVLQVVFNVETQSAVHARAEELRSEYVVAVEGELVARKQGTVNPAIATGEVELVADRLLILNDARTPPFSIEDEVVQTEETRLRYRFVDLRAPRMQMNFQLRHNINQEVRRSMTEQGFLEIETPFLTRSTPEGARDYLVPSRVQQGSFYALPQSPQLFKQILMISGFDRYFQIVRCFRDEDLRADRQPEFTQIDFEMSYAQLPMIFEVVEPLMERVWAFDKLARSFPGTPFPQLTYSEALSWYGTDKPDLRYEEKILTLDSSPSAELADEFGIVAPIVAFKFSQQNLRINQPLSRTAIKTLIQTVTDLAHNSLAELKARQNEIGRSALFIDWCLVEEGSRLLRDSELARSLQSKLGAKEGDVLFLGAVRGSTEPRDRYLPNKCFDILRSKLKDFTLDWDPKAVRFLWVLDFPMFEWDGEQERYVAAHHPFTSPKEEHLEQIESNPGMVKAKAYDLVLNGTELGSGSIRIHRKDVQSRIFRALGMSEEQARQRFGFFLDALEYGTPPHGGMALGLDRIVMILAGESSLREVIAFPKTARAVDLMCDAPTPVSSAQLKELGLQLRKE
jgi:aspartyl-tRNA synthetase